jgi:hypothetical protein
MRHSVPFFAFQLRILSTSHPLSLTAEPYYGRKLIECSIIKELPLNGEKRPVEKSLPTKILKFSLTCLMPVNASWQAFYLN